MPKTYNPKLTDGEQAILRVITEEGSQTRDELLELGPNEAVSKRITRLKRHSFIRLVNRSGFHGREFELGVNGFLWSQSRPPVRQGKKR